MMNRREIPCDDGESLDMTEAEIADAFGAMWGVVADTMKAGAAEE